MHKIFLGFVLIIFCSCDRKIDHGVNACGTFKIDTASILKNRNLEKLILKLEAAKLTSYQKTDLIPSFIKAFLDSAEQGKFTIADPGETWESTDNITDAKLPRRQLVYMGIGQDVALLTFYKGGVGTSERILIFQFRNSCIEDFWCGGVLADLKNKNEILKHLRDNIGKDGELNTNLIYW